MMPPVRWWSEQPRWLQLILVLLMACVATWANHEGVHMEGDPIVYAKLSWLDAQGLPFWDTWTFTERTALIKPVAWLVSWLEPGLTAFAIWPFTLFLLLLLFLWWVLDSQPVLQFWGLLFAGLTPWLSGFSTQLFPDPGVTVCVLAGLAIWFKGLERNESFRMSFLPVFVPVGLVLASLFKLSVVYLILPLMLAGVYEWIHNQNRSAWLWLAGWSVLIALLVFTEGSLISRISHADADHNASPFSYSWDAPDRMMNRLFTEPLKMVFGNPTIGILVFPALAGAFRVPPYYRGWLMAAGLLLVIHWLGSTSLSRYTPLPASPRMWMLMAVPMMLLAAVGLKPPSAKPGRPEQIIWLMMMAVTAIIGAVYSMPGAVITGCVGIIFLPVEKMTRIRQPLVMMVVLLWFGYRVSEKDKRYYQSAEMTMIRQHVPEGAILLVDPVLAFGSFLYEKETDAKLLNWTKQDSVLLEGGREIFWLWNGFRMERANLYEERIPVPAGTEKIFREWDQVGADPRFDLRLFRQPEVQP